MENVLTESPFCANLGMGEAAECSGVDIVLGGNLLRRWGVRNNYK